MANTKKSQKKSQRKKVESVRISRGFSDNSHVSGVVPTNNVLDLRSIAAKREVTRTREERKKQVGVLRSQANLKKQEEAKQANTLFSLRKRNKKRRHKKMPQLEPIEQVELVDEFDEFETEPQVEISTADIKPQKKKSIQDELREMLPPLPTLSARDINDTEDLQGLNALIPADVVAEPVIETVAEEAVEVIKTIPAAGESRLERKQQRLEAKIAAREIKEEARASAKEAKVLRKEQAAYVRAERESFWARPLKDAALAKVDSSKLPVIGFSFKAVMKPALAFAVVAMIIVLPASVSAMLNRTGSLENQVLQSTEDAFGYLQQAGASMQGLDFDGAESEFTMALNSFAIAQQDIENINSFVVSIAKYIPGKGQAFYSGKNLIAAGEELAAAGEQLSKALGVLSEADVESIAQDESSGLTPLLVVAHSALNPAVINIDNAIAYLNEVQISAVPEDKQDLVLSAQAQLPVIYEALNEGLELTEVLLAFLGHEEEKRYLVLFQNNYEIRPTGGFIGSIAVLDIFNGVVTGIDIPGGGVYDVSGQFQEKLIAPEPLHLVNPHWNLPDANWFPHFPTSSQKIQWFYERSGGTEVDGVITIVPSVIESLLEISGPIDMTEEYDVVLDVDNFYDEVQVRAEEKYDETRESKQILADMTPILFNQLFSSAEDPESMINILTLLRTALAEKDILVAMNDVSLQEKFSERDWSGELKNTDRDYLFVVHANIAGGKTDKVIEEVVKHHAEIQPDGSVVDTVTLTRVHKGPTNSEFSGIKNTDFVRFYVPQGSELISAVGFDTPDDGLFKEPDSDAQIDEDLARVSGEIIVNSRTGVHTNEEFNKTVIGGWLQTAAGESSTVTLKYKLPFKIETGSLWNQTDRYSLLVQKQPGSFGSFFVSEVELPDNIKATRYYPETYSGADQVLLTQDYFSGMVLEQAN